MQHPLTQPLVLTLIEVSDFPNEAQPTSNALMNDEIRSQRRGRPRRRPDGGGGPRRQAPRPLFQGRRNNYATGRYSSIYAGPFPPEGGANNPGLNLAVLQSTTA